MSRKETKSYKMNKTTKDKKSDEIEINDKNNKIYGVLSPDFRKDIKITPLKKETENWPSCFAFVYGNYFKNDYEGYRRKFLNKNIKIKSDIEYADLFSKYEKNIILSTVKDSLLKAYTERLKDEEFVSSLLSTGMNKLYFDKYNTESNFKYDEEIPEYTVYDGDLEEINNITKENNVIETKKYKTTNLGIIEYELTKPPGEIPLITSINNVKLNIFIGSEESTFYENIDLIDDYITKNPKIVNLLEQLKIEKEKMESNIVNFRLKISKKKRNITGNETNILINMKEKLNVLENDIQKYSKMNVDEIPLPIVTFNNIKQSITTVVPTSYNDEKKQLLDLNIYSKKNDVETLNVDEIINNLIPSILTEIRLKVVEKEKNKIKERVEYVYSHLTQLIKLGNSNLEEFIKENLYDIKIPEYKQIVLIRDNLPSTIIDYTIKTLKADVLVNYIRKIWIFKYREIEKSRIDNLLYLTFTNNISIPNEYALNKDIYVKYITLKYIGEVSESMSFEKYVEDNDIILEKEKEPLIVDWDVPDSFTKRMNILSGETSRNIKIKTEESIRAVPLGLPENKEEYDNQEKIALKQRDYLNDLIDKTNDENLKNELRNRLKYYENLHILYLNDVDQLQNRLKIEEEKEGIERNEFLISEIQKFIYFKKYYKVPPVLGKTRADRSLSEYKRVTNKKSSDDDSVGAIESKEEERKVEKGTEEDSENETNIKNNEEESDKEESDKEESDKEESNGEESDKEESNGEESDELSSIESIGDNEFLSYNATSSKFQERIEKAAEEIKKKTNTTRKQLEEAAVIKAEEIKKKANTTRKQLEEAAAIKAEEIKKTAKTQAEEIKKKIKKTAETQAEEIKKKIVTQANTTIKQLKETAIKNTNNFNSLKYEYDGSCNIECKDDDCVNKSFKTISGSTMVNVCCTKGLSDIPTSEFESI
jgi:hypothetical protein